MKEKMKLEQLQFRWIDSGIAQFGYDYDRNPYTLQRDAMATEMRLLSDSLRPRRISKNI